METFGWDLFYHVLVAVIIFVANLIYFKRKTIVRNFKSFYYYRRKCRCSFASLLKICYEDKYLLVRNVNRPEVFGPIGGTYKCYETAKSFLDDIEFRQQQTGNIKVKNDLRGFIPVLKLYKLIDWFCKKTEREVENISREIREELEELGIAYDFCKDVPKFRFLKEISEGPYLVKEQNYVQYRYFEIYELVATEAFNLAMLNHLLGEMNVNDNIILVTAEEIKKRRHTSSKKVIGSYCGYLIGDKRMGEEEVPYN